MKKIVVLTGAGMSAESGISTFRDTGGLWEKYPVEQVATPEGYEANPKLVLDFYNARRRQLGQVEPNKGHRLLAQLESHFDVQVITQNVDNLHERAGSTQVVHLHGELMKATSTLQPNSPDCIVELPSPETEIHLGDKAHDGSQLRPFIVWFGEAVPMIDVAAHLVSQADLLIIIGTSLNVYPAAGLVGYAPIGIPIYIIDPKPVQIPYGLKAEQLAMGASEGLTRLLERPFFQNIFRKE